MTAQFVQQCRRTVRIGHLGPKAELFTRPICIIRLEGHANDQEDPLFPGGSAAVLVAGLGTGLVAYYGGGFPALSASTGPIELRYVPADATRRRLRRRPRDHGFRAPAAPQGRHARARAGAAGIPGADRHRHRARHRLRRRRRHPGWRPQPSRPRRRARPVQRHAARGAGPRARRRGRGIQGQAALNARRTSHATPTNSAPTATARAR